MPILLVLIFIGVPVLEIAIFIQAGKLIGLWPTLAVVVLTAVAGASLLRAQGLAALGRAREQLDQGRVPVEEVFTGACLLVGGALLLTPGFFTDTVGFLLLIPPVRAVIGRWIMSALVRSPNSRVWVDGEEIMSRGRGNAPRDGVIDVDYTEIDETDDNPDSDKPPPG